MTDTVKSVFIDTIFDFGKYKGQAVEHVTELDPGYFYWLQESGYRRLDERCTKVANDWAVKNPRQAEKTRMGARKGVVARSANKAQAMQAAAPQAPVNAAVSSGDVPSSRNHPMWGTW